MTRVPLVSFIVLCHNYGRYLGECVDSILRQSIGDFDVIVIDDGSSDNTADVMAGLRDPRVRCITHPRNLGLLYSLTEGFREARGQFVARIDADDRYRPYFLEETLPILQARPQVGMVYGDAASIDENGTILEDPWPGLRSREVHQGRDSEGDEFLDLLEDNVIPASAVIGRREAWQATLPFPEWFTWASPSDWYMNLGVARRYPVAYRARTLGDYRMHRFNMHRQPAPDRHAESTIVHVLDEMLSGDDRREAKARVRRRLYGKAYLAEANRYFGAGMTSDARRCYMRAFRYQPGFMRTPGPLRHFAATFVNKSTYDELKRAWSGTAGR